MKDHADASAGAADDIELDPADFAETSRAQLRAAMDRAFAAFKKQDAELTTDIGRLRSKSATAKAVLASRQRAVLELEQVLG